MKQGVRISFNNRHDQLNILVTLRCKLRKLNIKHFDILSA